MTILLGLTAVVVSFALMPFAYGLITFGFAFPQELRGALLSHVLQNCFANALVMLGALMLTGRLDRKLAAVLIVVLIIHGALAFLILTTRGTYSNQIMLTAVASSVVLGSAFMYLKHRLARVRVALLCPDDVSVSQGIVTYDRIRDPNTDLRPYDILLITSVVELTPEWARVLSRAMLAGKPVRHVVEYVEEEQGIVSIDHFDLDHLPVGGLTSYRPWKRTIDLILVLIASPIAVLFIGISALVISCTMGRPVFFVQPRVGLGGRIFRMYKLRSMKILKQGEEFATVLGDVRVTPFGAWIRRFRIDELPQFWNIVKGDMSLIGPRPEQPALTEAYKEKLPAFVYRSLVRPGITGWAQVRSGYAADLEETRLKLSHDLFYLKNFSFSLDLQIILRTVVTLVTGKGGR